MKKDIDKPDVSEEKVIEEQSPDMAKCSSCEDYKIGWQRALADYDNLQKNMTRERAQMRDSVRESFAESLLPVVDNFDQAVKFTPTDLPASAQGWLQGVMYVQQQFTDVLSQLGVESYGEVGQIFDPNIHASSSEKKEEGKQAGEILEIIQRGWRIGQKIIRPALVIVQSNS